MSVAAWSDDPNLYVFTSLSAGSSHIVTATSRLETILRANRLHFTYIDTATNEGARKLYTRRAAGRKLPLLVKQGEVLGDINEIEELNEFGELKDVVGKLPPPGEKSIVTPAATLAGPYSGSLKASSANHKGDIAGSLQTTPAEPPRGQVQQALAAEVAAKALERRSKPSSGAATEGLAQEPTVTADSDATQDASSVVSTKEPVQTPASENSTGATTTPEAPVRASVDNEATTISSSSNDVTESITPSSQHSPPGSAKDERACSNHGEEVTVAGDATLETYVRNAPDSSGEDAENRQAEDGTVDTTIADEETQSLTAGDAAAQFDSTVEQGSSRSENTNNLKQSLSSIEAARSTEVAPKIGSDPAASEAGSESPAEAESARRTSAHSNAIDDRNSSTEARATSMEPSIAIGQEADRLEEGRPASSERPTQTEGSSHISADSVDGTETIPIAENESVEPLGETTKDHAVDDSTIESSTAENAVADGGALKKEEVESDRSGSSGSGQDAALNDGRGSTSAGESARTPSEKQQADDQAQATSQAADRTAEEPPKTQEQTAGAGAEAGISVED